MKLSNFPYIVQKEILDHLSINNIFFLSLCSKRTKNFITQIQKYQFQKVDHVTYWTNPEGVLISVRMMSRGYDDIFMCCYKSLDEFAKVLSDPEDTAEELRVNVSGSPIVFFRSNRSDLHAKYCCNNLESANETIHDYLCDILGHHTKSWLKSTVLSGTHVLPHIRKIEALEIQGGMIDSRRIEELLCTSCGMLSMSELNVLKRHKLRENSKFYDRDTVYVDGEPFTYRAIADFLKHFNGRHAFLSKTFFFAEYIVRFLNSWKSGKKFRKLEVISMDCFIVVSSVRNSVEFKEVNTEVEYSFIRRFQKGYPASIQPCEFKSRLYMVRESDGLVASVMLSHWLIFMGVWDLTEKQFLARFK